MDEKHLARLAAGAYESPDIAENYAKEIDTDWMVDRDLTTNHSTVYRNDNTKRTVISFRGTKDKSDLKTDIAMFFGAGEKTNKFKDAHALTDKVLKKYGITNLELSSHSLGASVGSSVSKKTGIPSTSFSKGKTLLPTRKAKNEKVIRNILDPLSGSAILPGAFSLPNVLIGGIGRIPKSLNTHSLSNFT